MSDVVNPLDHELLYNSIILGGVTSPGVVKLSGHDRKIGWDIKKGPGQSGATTTRTSEDPVEFTATFYLVRDASISVDDIDRWPAFDGLIRSTVAGKTPKALPIYHPDLTANGIVSVVLSKFGGVVHDGKGGQTIAVTFLEYKPPKPQGNSPKPKPKAKGPDPDQAALDELSKLTAQYKATPWG
jgi:hypothetical protein